MPLSSIRKIDNHTVLGFWEITENTATLLSDLQACGPPSLEIPAYQHPGRQTQWLASRLLAYTLLKEFTAELPLLLSDIHGKPVFKNPDYRISISHTTDRAVVIISDTYEVGIDIENIHPKVLRVKSKFLSDSELQQAGNDPENVMIYWCAKEALYKLYSKGQVLFKEHLFIKPFAAEKTTQLEGFIRTPDHQKKYWLPYEKHPGFIVTYCIDTFPDLDYTL